MFEDDNIRLHHILDSAREAVTFAKCHKRADLDTDRVSDSRGEVNVRAVKAACALTYPQKMPGHVIGVAGA